jgi:hypothetical protein
MKLSLEKDICFFVRRQFGVSIYRELSPSFVWRSRDINVILLKVLLGPLSSITNGVPPWELPAAAACQQL